MIKQYIIFSALILIAALVLNSVQWEDNDLGQTNSTDDLTGELSVAGTTDASLSDLGSTDIRGGGQLGLQGSMSNFSSQTQSATSTAFQAATSTQQLIRSNPVNPFSGDNSNEDGSSIEYVRLSDTQTQNKEADRNISPPRPVATTKDKLIQEKTSFKKPTPSADKDKSAQEDDKKDEQTELISDIRLRGHVVDENGAGVVGMALELKLIQALPEQKAQFNNRVLKAVTNDKGFYAFDNLVEGDYQVCTGTETGYGSACQRKRAPHAATDFSVRSISNAFVYGLIKDESGAPMSDVSISATPRQRNRVKSDEKGEFKLSLAVNAGVSYKVYFSKKDFRRESAAVTGEALLSEGKQHLEVVMKSFDRGGFEVTGTVQDESGELLQGRSVRLYSPSLKLAYQLRGSTGKDGRFVIKDVQAANDYRLSLNTSGGYIFDSTQYQNLEIYEGVAPLQLRVKSTGKGSVSARIYASNREPLSGVKFRLSSGGSLISGTTDRDGLVTFKDVPATLDRRTLTIGNTTSPHFSFSGITLAPGEHKSLTDLLVDSGDYSLLVTVQNESGLVLAGANGNLTWHHEDKGVKSKTTRSVGKISHKTTGIITFSGMGPGVHTLRVSKAGYETYSEEIDINQLSQNQLVKLVSK